MCPASEDGQHRWGTTEMPHPSGDPNQTIRMNRCTNCGASGC